MKKQKIKKYIDLFFNSESSIIKKIRAFKILLGILLLILMWSGYKAYTKEINPLPVAYIEIFENKNKIHVDNTFNIQIRFQNIPEEILNDAKIKSFLRDISISAELFSYNIYQDIITNRLGEKYRSCYVSANYTAKSPSKSKRIKLQNNDGEEFIIEGEFPEIYALSEFDFNIDLAIIYPGEEFTAKLILRNVEKNAKVPNIRFADSFSVPKPIAIGVPIIQFDKGLREEIYVIVRQKFKAEKPGKFYLQPITTESNGKKLILKELAVNVSALNITHRVNFDHPQKVNEIFAIEVILSNCLKKQKTPIFPNIIDCKKLDLNIREEALGNRLYNYIYSQSYRIEYDGQYNAQEVIIFKGDEKIEYLLGLFTVEFDCSTADLNRPQSGFEPIKGSGFARGSERNIKITNNTDEDIFVKLINNYKKKSIRTKYIRKSESTAINDLPAGTFYLACSSGSHWDIKNKRFRCNKDFFIFDKYDHLMTFKYQEYGDWKFTIYKQRTYSYSEGPKDISETAFDNL